MAVTTKFNGKCPNFVFPLFLSGNSFNSLLVENLLHSHRFLNQNFIFEVNIGLWAKLSWPTMWQTWRHLSLEVSIKSFYSINFCFQWYKKYKNRPRNTRIIQLVENNVARFCGPWCSFATACLYIHEQLLNAECLQRVKNYFRSTVKQKRHNHVIYHTIWCISFLRGICLRFSVTERLPSNLTGSHWVWITKFEVAFGSYLNGLEFLESFGD